MQMQTPREFSHILVCSIFNANSIIILIVIAFYLILYGYFAQ